MMSEVKRHGPRPTTNANFASSPVLHFLYASAATLQVELQNQVVGDGIG